MVDPWRHWPDEEYPDDSNDPQEEQEKRFLSVQSQVGKEVQWQCIPYMNILICLLAQVAKQQAANPSAARAAILRLTSERAAELFANDSLDFCYIDAQHDFLRCTNTAIDEC